MMMSDFLLFLRNIWVIAHFLRGILLCMCVVLILLAVILTNVERMSFGEAIYFTLITGLTVGYGDVTPMTASGKAISVFTAFVGVIATGIYVAVATKAVSTSVLDKHTRAHRVLQRRIDKTIELVDAVDRGTGVVRRGANGQVSLFDCASP